MSLQLQAHCDVLRDRLTIRYRVSNHGSAEVFAANRFGPYARCHPGSIAENPHYTTSSAAVYLLPTGETLVFQGPTIVPFPTPFSFPEPCYTRIPPGRSIDARIDLALPLRQAHGHGGTEHAAPSEFAHCSRIWLAIHIACPPLVDKIARYSDEWTAPPIGWFPNTPVRALDGTDAVSVEARGFERLSSVFDLPQPIEVERDERLSRWGVSHAEMIREGRSRNAYTVADSPELLAMMPGYPRGNEGRGGS